MPSYRKGRPFPHGAPALGPAEADLGDGSGAWQTIVAWRFERERVVVSGGRFERCTFIACELVFDGRPTQLIDSTFEGCQWAFEGAAGTTLAFVEVLCREDPQLKAMLARTLGLVDEQTH
jgi:hypothetical protein